MPESPDPSTDLELVSVVVPVFNNPSGLQTLLGSLSRLDDSHFEVIVVDDASTQPLPRLSSWVLPNLKVIRLQRNSGPALARNFGVEHSRGEILAFTDADCTVKPNWLAEIRKTFRTKSIQAVAGTFDEYPQPSALTWLHYLGCTFFKIPGGQYVHCFNTNNFAIRRKTFAKMGGFPDYRIGEDLMLGYGLQKQGIEVYWSDSLVVQEAFRDTVTKYFRQQFARSFAILEHYLSDISVYFIKWPVRRNNLQLQLIVTALLLLIGLLPIAASLGTAMLSFSAALAVLFWMNLPFLRYAWSKAGLGVSVKVFFLAVFVRNVAWLLGSAWLLLSSPKLALAGLFALQARGKLARI